MKRLTASTPFNGATTTFNHSYPVIGEYEIRIAALAEIPNIFNLPEKAEQLNSDILNRMKKGSKIKPEKFGVKTIPIKIVENTSSAIEISISADIQSATVNEQVNFTSTVSGGQAPYTYEWDFDNNGEIDSTSINPSYLYTVEGMYSATLTVTDDHNNRATASLDINVTEYTTLDSCPMVYDAALDNDGNTTYIYLIHDTYSDGGYKDYTRCRYHSLEYLQRETQYVNGQMNGPDKHFTASGFLEWDTPYIEGIRHGLIKEYYESGQLARETPYNNGIVHGNKKQYDLDGQLISCMIYENGIHVGSCMP